MKVYLREFETAPKGANVETGRQGGRFFNAENREQFEAWFKARPGIVKAHAGEPVVAKAPKAPKAEKPVTPVVDEVAAKREEKNAKERARRAAKKAAQAAG